MASQPDSGGTILSFATSTAQHMRDKKKTRTAEICGKGFVDKGEKKLR